MKVDPSGALMLNSVVDHLSSGVGLVDSSTHNLVHANKTLQSWLHVARLPASVVQLVPGIKVDRLDNVVTKNRKYRTKFNVSDNGIQKSASLVVSSIVIDEKKPYLLLEASLDETKQEVDALISSYQETMENFKAQLLRQKALTVDAINAKAALLVNMNEQLERQVRNRTTELEHAKSKLSHQANHDVLTGLPNRRLFEDRLEHAVSLSLRNAKRMAVLYLDLDKFKQINDSLGHKVGDELLKEVANRLRGQVRSGDTIARMGGDEFCVIAEDVSNDGAAEIAERIIESVTQVVQVNGYELYVSVSIGICMLDDIERTDSTITQGADAAMYRVKADGKNGYLFFDATVTSSLTARVTIERELRQAIPNGELFLDYQPKFDLRTGAVVGCEALIRWKHPVKGIVSPGEFVLVAEEVGLINDIGQWVLEAAIDQILAWQSRGVLIPSVSINISGKQLESASAMNQIVDTVQSASIDPDLLEFELTESVLMGHTSSDGMNCLETLKANGHEIAIDDFGTGYSSLSYLRYLPVTGLKIDRSFVSDLSKGEDQEALVTAILGIAKSMKLKVVAEGVETPEQLEFLIQHACDQGQGFLFAKPQGPKQLEEFVAAQHSVLSR